MKNQSRKKKSHEKLQEREVFFSETAFYELMCSSMLICVGITWKDHRFCSTLTQIPEAQVSVPRQEPGNSANLVTETHHDFPPKKDDFLVSLVLSPWPLYF